MKKTLRCEIGGARLFGGVKSPESKITAVVADEGRVFAALLVVGCSERQILPAIAPAMPLVFGVRSPGDISEILYPVVIPAAVFMVNFAGRQDAFHVEPCKMVCWVFLAADADFPVAMGIHPAGLLPSTRSPFGPEKFTRGIVVGQHLAQAALGKITALSEQSKDFRALFILFLIPLQPAANGGLGNFAEDGQSHDRPAIPVKFFHQRDKRSAFFCARPTRIVARKIRERTRFRAGRFMHFGHVLNYNCLGNVPLARCADSVKGATP